MAVSNLAVVEKAEVDFAPGLNVLTGETGAGKSVLMGALELVIGGRSDSSAVRDGAREARVEAVFDFGVESANRARIRAVLEDCGIEDADELVIRRTVGVGGGGKVWINDSAATVATLKKLGVILVDIHGPRANQSILEERFQRSSLDSHGSVATGKYDAAWAELVKCRVAIAKLEASENVEDEIDLLKFQTGEIEEAGISSDDDDLAERHAAAAHAGEIVEAANEITEALGGDDGVSSLMARVHARVHAVERFFPEAAEWATEADEIAVRADELSRCVADAASRLDADPDELARMDARLAVVNRLKRKYGAADAATLAGILAQKKARLEELEQRGVRLEELRREEVRLVSQVESLGATLRAARTKAGKQLAKAVTDALRTLGFAQAKFTVSVEAAAPSRTGCDKVEFVFEPNPGESARPLAAIASSGEAARVMLAIKGALAEHDGTDLLVFDEIDANIGGETGKAVGERMRSVATHHQVIAITHLPQSAVFGERHFVVSKSVSGGRTRTSIRIVEGEDRMKEIARMFGGGEAALEHARKLIVEKLKG